MIAYPKPKYKKKRAKNNPVPTYDQVCRYHPNRHYAQTHEVYEGNGRRQLSIQYGMQVHLCPECHREVHANPLRGKDLELKQEFQRKFETQHGRDMFIKTFMRNYLD